MMMMLTTAVVKQGVDLIVLICKKARTMLFVFHCGVIGAQLYESIGSGLVVLLWCWSARRQGQRYQNGSKFWDKDGKSGHPCAPSSTPWCTIVCLLVHICTPLCAICILKHTLADPLLHPDVQLYTLACPYTVVHSGTLSSHLSNLW